MQRATLVGNPFGGLDVLPVLPSVAESHYRRTPPAGLARGIGKAVHERCTVQYPPYDFALNAYPAPVDDANEPEPKGVCFFEVGFDNSFYIARGHGVEIENVRDRDANRFLVFGFVHLPIFAPAKTMRQPHGPAASKKCEEWATLVAVPRQWELRENRGPFLLDGN